MLGERAGMGCPTPPGGVRDALSVAEAGGDDHVGRSQARGGPPTAVPLPQSRPCEQFTFFKRFALKNNGIGPLGFRSFRSLFEVL